MEPFRPNGIFFCWYNWYNCIPKKQNGCWPFVSSFWLSLHWICSVYSTFHTLCNRKTILIVCQKGINAFQMLCIQLKVVEIIHLSYVVPCWLNNIGINIINFYSNLGLIRACDIKHRPLLQHICSKIFFACASNAIDQMIFCCIAVFQYIAMICQCGASANAFETRRVISLTVPKSLPLIKSNLFHMSTSRILHVWQYKKHHGWVNKSMDAVTAGEHLWYCRHGLWLRLPLTLPLISLYSSRWQWICNNHAGFWICHQWRQILMTAERSGSASNAGCWAGFNTTHWVCQCGFSRCRCATTPCTKQAGWSL